MKERFDKFKKNIFMAVFAFGFLLFGFAPLNAVAADASPVEVTEIDYDQAYMKIDPNGNTKVYYAASGKTVWNEIEGIKDEDGCLVLDISWIPEKSDYKMDLKGSDDKTIVTLTLPAANTKLKVTYNQVLEELVFTNEDGSATFEWKKSTSYDGWNTEYPISQEGTKGAAFKNAMEALKAKGGKIIVRIPQQIGTSATETGARPSKQVAITIAKRAAAPSMKVNVNTLLLNTSAAWEYQIYSLGGVLQNTTVWKECSKGMSVSDIAPQVLYGTSAGKEVVIAVRKKATAKSGYSKTSYLTIPAQLAAPTEIIKAVTATSYSISFPQASKANPYQYAVVKAGNTANEEKLPWKSVTTTKAINFKAKSLHQGSTIYVRLKGVTASKTAELRIPGTFTKITVSYSE